MSEVFDTTLEYSPDTFKERFETIFKKNISEADGILLSGGTDSSLIAYFLSKTKNKVPAFTGVTKDSNSKIEKERAIKTANLFCSKHSLIELNSDSFEKNYSGIFKNMDEPFSDNAILGTSIIANNASKNGIRFLIEGEGGDELFGHADKIKKYLFLRKFLPNKYIQKILYPLIKLSEIFKVFNMDKAQLINRFSAKNMKIEEFSQLVLKNFESINDNDIISLSILLSLNIGMEIHKNKLASYYSGCNIVAPFLNIDLLKLALTIPPKIKYKRERAIIRNLYDSKMKRENYDYSKIGMTVPTADWILDNHKDILLNNRFYKNDETNVLIENYESNPTTYSDQKIWRVFVLNQWYLSNISKFRKNI